MGLAALKSVMSTLFLLRSNKISNLENLEDDSDSEDQTISRSTREVNERIKTGITCFLSFVKPDDEASFNRRKVKEPIHLSLLLLFFISNISLEWHIYANIEQPHNNEHITNLWIAAFVFLVASTVLIFIIYIVEARCCKPSGGHESISAPDDLERKQFIGHHIGKFIASEKVFTRTWIAMLLTVAGSLTFAATTVETTCANITEMQQVNFLVTANMALISFVMGWCKRHVILLSILPLMGSAISFALCSSPFRDILQRLVIAFYIVLVLCDKQYRNMCSFIVIKYTRDAKQEELNRKAAQVEHTAIINSLLPRAVSDALKQGIKVEPELFDNVTLFFSDVEGFTSICSECSPMKVFDMLNELYTVMDYCTTLFPLYKVETIGDAYMASGGLPERDVNHAQHIADFALMVRAVCLLVRNPITGEPLRIRIGIHSGPVMAGVVGNLMPRYCLFGDTVNVANRMETAGMVGGIHCSGEVAAILRATGDYVLSDRGEMHIKGKGPMRTFWLESADPKNKRSSIEKINEVVLQVKGVLDAYTAGNETRKRLDDNGLLIRSAELIDKEGDEDTDLTTSNNDRSRDAHPASNIRPQSGMIESDVEFPQRPLIESDFTGLTGMIVMKETVQRKCCVKLFGDADATWHIYQAASGEEGLRKLKAMSFKFNFIVISGDSDFFSGKDLGVLNEQEMVLAVKSQFERNSCIVIAIGGGSVLRNQSLKDLGIDKMWNRPVPYSSNEIKRKIIAIYNQKSRNNPRVNYFKG